MNKKIGVPLDPDWSGTGTAKWSQAYKAVSYHVTLYENGKKRTSETVKRGNTIDFSGNDREQRGKEGINQGPFLVSGRTSGQWTIENRNTQKKYL